MATQMIPPIMSAVVMPWSPVLPMSFFQLKNYAEEFIAATQGKHCGGSGSSGH